MNKITLPLLLLLTIQLFGQGNRFALSSEVNNDKANYERQLNELFKSYTIHEIIISDDVYKSINQPEIEYVDIQLDRSTYALYKYDLVGLDEQLMLQNTAITLTSDSHANLTINEHFINGIFESGEDYLVIQPLRDFIAEAPQGLYITYLESDILASDEVHTCGAVQEALYRKESINQKLAASECERIQLAIANDYSMYTKYGSIQGVMNHNTAVLNNVRTLYRSDFISVIEFEIVDFFIPTSSAQDPFTSSTNVNTLLSNFRTWATGNNNPWDDLSYDMGQFWSNRDFAGTTIGFADTPVPTSGYFRVFHILQDYTSNATGLKHLTVHEMGHNFSALHDPTGSTFIMGPSIGPGTQDAWSSASINNINTRINTIGDNLLNCSCGEQLSGPSLICKGDSDVLTLTVSQGVGPYTVVYTDGTTQFTLNNYVSGASINIAPTSSTTYRVITIEDLGSGGLSFVCGSSMEHLVEVFDEAGVASANGTSGSYDIDNCTTSTGVSLSSNISILDQDQIIGWWITEDNPISSTLTNANLNAQLNGANIGGSLSNPVNHIYESISGSPLQNMTLNVNCSTLDDTKDYYATPFVSNKRATVSDVSCNVNGSVFGGSATFNGVPAKLVDFFANTVCRPSAPLNDPTFNYRLTVSGYSGSAANHFVYVQSPDGQALSLNGNGTYNFTENDLGTVDDPGLENVRFWIWEQGGSGMANATVSVRLSITYPGAPAIVFPDISNVNSCLVGTPVQLNCSCSSSGSCNSSTASVTSGNIGSSAIVTSASDLQTIGTLELTISQATWQAGQSVTLNENFTVRDGSALSVQIGDCQ